MAAFRQHVAFSSLLGVGYAAGAVYLGQERTQAALAGVLCGFSGMLPDLDSDSGRPARELFGVLAAVVPLLLLHRLQAAGLTPEGVILAIIALYLAIRFGAAWLFHRLTVHRGMFHSLPAALIAAEITFLCYNSPQPGGRLVLAGGVFLGFLSHLLLDEIYGVNLLGRRYRQAKPLGGPLKLFSQHIPATLLTWLVLAGLSYLVAVDQGYLRPLHWSRPFPLAEQSSALR
jgi:membrane-bound metal-dependent hydrolase YbcI (DUF457 family)